MKTYLQMDGDRLVEYVEKREYDLLTQERADFGALVDKQDRELGDLISLLASEKSTRNHLIKRGSELERELDAAKQELQDAVKRMEDVTDADLVLAYWAGSRSTLVHEGANRVRTRLIQAAKGEQP